MSLDEELSVSEARNLLRWLGQAAGLTAECARHRDTFLEWYESIFNAGVTEGIKSLLTPGLDEDIKNLRLSNRVFNALERHGITTVGELLRHSSSDLSDIGNIGKRNLDELMDRLSELGLDLAEESIHGEKKLSKHSGEPSCPVKQATFGRR